MVFRPFTQLDETWHMIRREIESGALAESMMKVDHAGPSKGGVVIVYTSESNVERAGGELIKLVKHDIKYKTNRTTRQGRYAWKGRHESICEKTLYWNGQLQKLLIKHESKIQK